MRLPTCVDGQFIGCPIARFGASVPTRRTYPRSWRTLNWFIELRPISQQHNALTATVQPRRRFKSSAVAAAEAQQPVAAFPPLASLDLLSVVNVQGYILPDVPEGTVATVFALYDQSKTMQYIGFSKDLRASLRTVFARRPDKCHFYRALHLPRLDQEEMVNIRASWFGQNSGPPPGNKLPMERSAWQNPAEALAISDRGKTAAAEELAKQMLVKIQSRGCKEDFIPNPDLLSEGKVEFLAADALSQEEVDRQKLAAETLMKATRRCQTMVDDEYAPFDLLFTASVKTNGGYMFDVRVTFQEKESIHRVIVGLDYYEKQGIEAELVVERVFAFLLRKNIPRRTDGILNSSQFPVNYFSVSELHQFFADFEDEFDQDLPGDEKFWRFNRTQDYGYKGANEDPAALAAQFRLD